MRLAPPLALASLLACRSAPTASPPSLAPLRVSVRGACCANGPPPAANLAVAWFTAREWDALTREHAAGPLIEMMPRVRTARAPVGVGGVVAEVTLDGAPADAAVVLAIADTQGRFFDTLLGRGIAGNARGHADVRDRRATVQLEALAADPPRPERCAGDRFELVTLDAPEVRGDVGNPTQRRLCVRLPAGYAAAPARRYPVVFVLPGISGTDATVTGDFPAIADEAGVEAIYVGVDTSTRTGSTYFVDGPVTGAWASFFFERAVPAVDARFRTLARSAARAVMGHSTGGFNAVSLAFRRPDVLGAVASSSPDALDLARWLRADDGSVEPLWLGWMRVDDAMGGAGQMTSYGADWSPDPSEPRGFAWPVDLATGAWRPGVWARWLAHSPITWLDDAEGLARARRLSGRVFLTCGRADEARLFAPTARFGDALTARGIEHVWAPTEGGHLGQRRERTVPMIRFLGGVMEHAADVAAP